MRLLLCCVISTISLFTLSSAANTSHSTLRSVGVTVSDLSNPFFIRIAETVKEKVRREFGNNVKIIIKSNAYNQGRLEEQIQTFIELKLDLIILVAAYPYAIEPAIHRAQRDGIKVIAVDVNAAGADATVTTDNVQAGEVACDYLAKKIKGKGEVVIINGPPVSSVIERVAGCKSVLNNYPDIYLLSDSINGGGSEEGGIHSMARLLESFPQLDAVFAINDPTAAGAAVMAQQLNRQDIVIASVDGAPIAVKAFKDNNAVWSASAAQFPDVMAATAVDLGIKLIAGEKIEKNKVLIPAKLIRKENLHLYQGWE